MFELMRDLKGMAENSASWSRKCHIHKDTLLAANAIYENLYGANSTDNESTRVLPATFQMYFWIGWKPDPAQPQALQPQKSDVSLKDLYKLDEVVEGSFQKEIDVMNEIKKGKDIGTNDETKDTKR